MISLFGGFLSGGALNIPIDLNVEHFFSPFLHHFKAVDKTDDAHFPARPREDCTIRPAELKSGSLTQLKTKGETKKRPYEYRR